MNRWHQFTQLLLSRFREFYREPEAIFWVYGFPVILAVGLGIAFWNRKPDPAKVDVQTETNASLSEGGSASTEASELGNRLKSAGVKVELHTPEECRR